MAVHVHFGITDKEVNWNTVLLTTARLLKMLLMF